MAISQRTGCVAKTRTPPRKLWTEAIKEKLVQFANHNQPTSAQLTNVPKSRHNAALQEALQCKTCKMGASPYKMASDIKEGIYITSRYPPYFANKLESIEEISPLDASSRQPRNLSFWSDITYSQQRQYFEAVDAIIQKAEAANGKAASEAIVVYAHYQVDSHIRQHYMGTQSVFNMCRDKQDIADLHEWQWEVAAVDEPAATSNPDWGVDWASDPTNSLYEQYDGWKAREAQREDHLAIVRSQWARIQLEREEQRKKTLVFWFRGAPIRSVRFSPGAEPSLSEEEIMQIANETAHWVTSFAESEATGVTPCDIL
ncbi:uncharacterized protein N7506_011685 [Penicillium brevicompactum]|uniref:uncharacterized protein n=1 Tax=Penicillium brevicompactum TaxID=5074 RepID=UPI00253F9BB8|nr:uncharacterized protein N7506_011685 [Penicillium brevicompactum]KAJ5318981.1 hypothetical protein N7506_011685 [Penicillium brevicompactum]